MTLNDNIGFRFLLSLTDDKNESLYYRYSIIVLEAEIQCYRCQREFKYQIAGHAMLYCTGCKVSNAMKRHRLLQPCHEAHHTTKLAIFRHSLCANVTDDNWPSSELLIVHDSCSELKSEATQASNTS